MRAVASQRVTGGEDGDLSRRGSRNCFSLEGGDMPRLEGKVILVTGAGSGIGRASALLFAEEGGALVCADMAADAASETAEMIVEMGGQALAVEADVRKMEDAESIVEAATDGFGKLDILFNNAGTGIRGGVHALSESDWDLVIDTNLKGAFHCSKAALSHFMGRGSGNIVNTASTFGILASPNYPAYCASKGGIIMLTKQMALDYGPAVRVNCICPGATDTPRLRRRINSQPNPAEYEKGLTVLNKVMGRLADPREIAYAALFLASDESSFVTGHALVVDGGQTIDA